MRITNTKGNAPNLFTIASAAEYLDCAEITVRRMVSRGDLKAHRVGRMIRIKEQDLLRAIKPATNAHFLRGGDAA